MGRDKRDTTVAKQAGETDTGIATLRAHNGKMVSSSEGKREVLVEHYRKLETPTTNEMFDEEFATFCLAQCSTCVAQGIRGMMT